MEPDPTVDSHSAFSRRVGYDVSIQYTPVKDGHRIARQRYAYFIYLNGLLESSGQAFGDTRTAAFEAAKSCAKRDIKNSRADRLCPDKIILQEDDL